MIMLIGKLQKGVGLGIKLNITTVNTFGPTFTGVWPIMVIMRSFNLLLDQARQFQSAFGAI